jgi:hypothetical protein
MPALMKDLDNQIEHMVDAILARWVLRLALIGILMYWIIQATR